MSTTAAFFSEAKSGGFEAEFGLLTEEFLSPSYINRDSPPGTPSGPERIRQIVSLFRAAFPDLTITIEEQAAERDLVCSRTITHGTHRGELFGIPATGKSITMPGLTMVRIVDVRLVESWVRNDVMGMMKQVGAVT
jgi:predicted ester cyclase